jgi:hypothetical protein
MVIDNKIFERPLGRMDESTRIGSFLRSLAAAERFMERIAPVVAAALIVIFSVWTWFASRGLRLWYDELLEIAAASAPTSRDVVSFLAAGIDYNPPLSHFAVRASAALFGNTEWAVRLPSFLGIVALLVCLYLVISRWLGRNYGVLAILVAMCLQARIYGQQARPYGLVLGLSALALVFYLQAAQKEKRLLALAGFAVCSAGLVASHYYAALVIAAFFLAETVRTLTKGRIDWALIACGIVPPAIVLAILSKVIRQQHQALTHYFARGNLLSFNTGYGALEMDPIIYGTALTLIGCGLFAIRNEAIAQFHLPSFGSRELSAGVAFLLLPIVGAFCTQFVTHAYVARYFVPVVLGFCICLCFTVKVFSSAMPGFVLLMMIPFSLGFAKIWTHEVFHPNLEPVPGASLAGTTSPILFDSPGDYVQVYHYIPSLRGNMWVIADPEASLRYRQYDTDDKIMLAMASKGLVQTITLNEAVHRWPSFRLVPRPQDNRWVLNCLMSAGAPIRINAPFDKANFVMDVTLTPESLSLVEGCSSSRLRN